MKKTTLAYLTYRGKWLMLYRNRKPHDINDGKWIGTGGKLEAGETPRQCVIREIQEETGLSCQTLQYRGTVYFEYGDIDSEKMYVYTGETDTDRYTETAEGTLAWIPEEEVMDLPMWEGDRAFLPLLMREGPVFCISLLYNDKGDLLEVKQLPAETENQ